jgi:hypothetical protein
MKHAVLILFLALASLAAAQSTDTLETRVPNLIELFPEAFVQAERVNPLTTDPAKMRRKTIMQDGERVEIIEYIAEVDDQGTTITELSLTAGTIELMELMANTIRRQEARIQALERLQGTATAQGGGQR